MDIKEENVLSDVVASEFFIMNRNTDDVTVKTEIKSETPFTKHLVKQKKWETVTCSSNWNVDRKTEIEQTLLSDFGSHNEGNILPENPVMKDKKYNDHELCNKIEIKEEPWWLETETSSVCDDIKDEASPPVKSSRLCTGAVFGEGRKSPLLSVEISGRDTSFCNGKDHFVFLKTDATVLPTAEEHVPSEQSTKHSDHRDIHRRSLYLSQGSLIPKGKSPHWCKTCGKSFTRLSHLNTHKLFHEGKKPHQCKTCKKSFTLLSHLKTHTLIHEGKKPHQCITCGMSFTRLSHLKTHNLIHEGKKPYQCKTCDKSFTALSTLKRHNLIHEGKKPYQCKTCDKSFTQLSNLKTHNLIHEGTKPHKCKTCDKSFTVLSTLKRHSFIHEGKKPHQCKICNKSFAGLSLLKTHNLNHEGKKPHQCKTCAKSFTVLSTLNRHKLIHEGKKPHLCKTCNKSFTRFSSLKRHNLVHGGSEHEYTHNV